MTALRQAAKMALEALENLQGGCTDSDDGTVEAITVWCPEIIDALREALAQPEQEPVAWMMFGVDKPTRVILHKPSDEHKKVFSCIFPLYTHEEALAKPEPVAYRTVNNVGAYVYHSADRLPNEYGLRGEALYLHPAPIPEGWQLVPKEPTEEMVYAACQDGTSVDGKPIWKHTVDKQAIWKWKAMLAAAPKPEE